MVKTAVPSLPRRVVATFVSPGPLFERLSENPLWIGALLVAAVATALGTFLAPTELFEEMLRRQMLERGVEVPSNLDQTVLFARVASGVGALVVGPLLTAAMAGLAAFVFAFVLGDQGSYRQHLSVVSHAFLVPAVGNLLLLPLRIQTGDLALRLSVGTFLPFLDEGWLASALSWLDLFGLWGWILVALGATKIDPRRSWASATSVVLGLVVVVTFAVALIVAR